ncbi:MAG: 2-C-methyl-D-erythritol 2,4-cyclodiphosphate synthase [Pseudomonadota bacterium]
MRIGQGFDAHRFVEGSEIILGGVTIPHEKTIDAHSDGDVLLHALCDALLGAAGLGDIGTHFSDQDDTNKNRNSREFIVKSLEMIKAHDLFVSNVDITVILQTPKLAPYILQMRKNIAKDLDIDISQVNIKATTTEQMGFVGRQEGIAAMAIALLNNI